MIDITLYEINREMLLKNDCQTLIELERRTTNILVKKIADIALTIKADFDKASELKPFWEVYAPIQRGYKPKGEAFPWGEVGEKVVEGHLYSLAPQIFNNVRFIGIPYGHDVRFVTDEAFIHIDAKSTGPNDNPNEIVSSPNQVTGNGLIDCFGKIYNGKQLMKGRRQSREFQPELAPFYLLDSRVIPTLTYYLKIVYSVKNLGNQPLDYLELICVPNGLILFDGPNFNQKAPGLLIPGKDEVHVKRKRTRIRLDPLAKLNKWRCQKIKFNNGSAYIEPRLR